LNTPLKLLSFAVLCLAMRANAQQPAPASDPAKPPKATPQAEAGEPRANTSAAPAPATPVAGAPASPAPAPAASSPQSDAGEPRANTSRTPAAARPPAAAARPPAGTGQKTPGASDKLELGTATVTGDREQPKVMYIVPWKKSDIGDLAGKPMNSLVDEILAPVDRDVFKREVVYYNAVQADASQNGAPGRPSQQVEK
jgi:hypothetical protein